MKPKFPVCGSCHVALLDPDFAQVTLLPTHPMDSNTPPFLFTCPPAPVLMVSADGFAVTDGSLNEGKFTL